MAVFFCGIPRKIFAYMGWNGYGIIWNCEKKQAMLQEKEKEYAPKQKRKFDLYRAHVLRDGSVDERL